MADRYQDRHFPAPDEYDRGAYANPPEKESDPLAELARLIGQNDPFGGANKTPHPLQSRANARPPQAYQAEDEAAAPVAGPPPWMQRARQETAPPVLPQQQYEPQQYEEPEPDYQPSAVHPLHRYAAQQPSAAPAPQYEYHEELADQALSHEQDQSRYDDALYGQLEAGQQDLQRDPAYPDDPYAYQNDYAEDEPAPRKRASGLMTVAAVTALAVLGTGGAYAYRTYVGSPRSGEPPIIKADNTPTKVIPAPADAPAKTPDRMAAGDGTEKLVSREETPVDVNAKTGAPRVVFPALNQNGNPPSVASVTTTAPPLVAPSSNGTMPNGEPRKIRTLSVKGAEDTGAPAAKQATAPKPSAAPPASRGNPASANASANAPLSLAPGADPAPAAAPPTRVATTTPTPTNGGGGGYLVQVSSQKNEADAQSSYRSLQGKYASVLGSQPSVVKRVDLGEKGVFYRAFAGPFSSLEQATEVRNNLKAAGGPQGIIQRN
ncbi:SPOR domain-containing protein [Bradyrhizobium jicamae]|uniref:SPOR domain-containing protein n=1 Tax=Bradyrhizobium jicamae TaxID=280332 RepID=UPI001BA8779A|nr:SPOR domain-containing protein [Bradyrhizobium jicamae]MBR0758164.1 SPOR domain-containing protein [Bradyrhizobium jicamae]